jgi:hypothetical protein
VRLSISARALDQRLPAASFEVLGLDLGSRAQRLQVVPGDRLIDVGPGALQPQQVATGVEQGMRDIPRIAGVVRLGAVELAAEEDERSLIHVLQLAREVHPRQEVAVRVPHPGPRRRAVVAGRQDVGVPLEAEVQGFAE